MNTHSRSDAEKQVLEYSRIAKPILRSKPKAHQIIRRARPTQFRRHGRKFRVNQERDLRVMRALARYDRGAGVWASLNTLLAEVRKIEASLDGGAVQMTWSLRTLVRSLTRLRRDGLIASHEIRRKERARWGSRARSLHPEKFLPRECGARSKVECGAREVKGYKLHTSVKRDESRAGARGLSPLPEKALEVQEQTRGPEFPRAIDLQRPALAVPLLNMLSQQYGPEFALPFLCFATRSIAGDRYQQRRIVDPRSYVLSVSRNLLDKWEWWQVDTMLNRCEPKNPPYEFDQFTGRWHERSETKSPGQKPLSELIAPGRAL